MDVYKPVLDINAFKYIKFKKLSLCSSRELEMRKKCILIIKKNQRARGKGQQSLSWITNYWGFFSSFRRRDKKEKLRHRRRPKNDLDSMNKMFPGYNYNRLFLLSKFYSFCLWQKHIDTHSSKGKKVAWFCLQIFFMSFAICIYVPIWFFSNYWRHKIIKTAAYENPHVSFYSSLVLVMSTPNKLSETSSIDFFHFYVI